MIFGDFQGRLWTWVREVTHNRGIGTRPVKRTNVFRTDDSARKKKQVFQISKQIWRGAMRNPWIMLNAGLRSAPS